MIFMVDDSKNLKGLIKLCIIFPEDNPVQLKLKLKNEIKDDWRIFLIEFDLCLKNFGTFKYMNWDNKLAIMERFLAK